MQNFWVAVYSVLFAAIPLLLIGACSAFPAKWRARL